MLTAESSKGAVRVVPYSNSLQKRAEYALLATLTKGRGYVALYRNKFQEMDMGR